MILQPVRREISFYTPSPRRFVRTLLHLWKSAPKPGSKPALPEIVNSMKTFEDLEARGLIKQTTNTEKIRELLNGSEPEIFYIGFDPTADSLHIGHLLQIVTAKRLADAGHVPVMLIGTGTAMVGDPTGKTDARKVLPVEEVINNSMLIERQIKKIMGVPPAPAGVTIIDASSPIVHFVSNFEWLNALSWVGMLQDIGRHFSVNNMLRAECFKSRLEGGLSFLEFNYMIMQAFDFLHLHETLDCVLQVGGDDQWSNMLAGVDLIHKKTGHEVFAMTLPLLTNSDGTKMGKTERGAVWLDPNKTSPFEFFQFWRNIPDDKVKDCINFFTHEVNSKESILLNINIHKKFLAFEVTSLVHGKELAQQALEQAEALFEKRDTSTMESVTIPEGTHVLDMLVNVGFSKSRTDGRNQIINRGITINNEVLTDPTAVISKDKFGNDIVVRKGKKHFCRLLIEDKCLDQTQ
jgi:tyrosyl-tRNA synthetase